DRPRMTPIVDVAPQQMMTLRASCKRPAHAAHPGSPNGLLDRLEVRWARQRVRTGKCLNRTRDGERTRGQTSTNLPWTDIRSDAHSARPKPSSSSSCEESSPSVHPSARVSRASRANERLTPHCEKGKTQR